MATAKKAAKAEAPKAEESKALAAAPQAALPVAQDASAAWGSEGLSNSDIIVPKILVMQGLSVLVADGVANVGQIRDSLEGNLLGGLVKPKEAPVPVEVIPFSTFRTWVCFEKRNGKDEYVKTVPISPENEGWAINEIINGVEIRRDKCLNFYVLLPSEIAGGAAFPYLVSFRRTSMQAGKKLTTIAAKMRVFNQPLATKVINLTVAQQENEKGKFFVFDLSAGRTSTPEELAEAKKWHMALKTATVKVDDSDLKQEAPARAPSAGAPGGDEIDY